MLFCIMFVLLLYTSQSLKGLNIHHRLLEFCVVLFLKQRKKLGLYSIYVVLPVSWWDDISFDSGYETKRFGSCLI